MSEKETPPAAAPAKGEVPEGEFLVPLGQAAE